MADTVISAVINSNLSSSFKTNTNHKLAFNGLWSKTEHKVLNYELDRLRYDTFTCTYHPFKDEPQMTIHNVVAKNSKVIDFPHAIQPNIIITKVIQNCKVGERLSFTEGEYKKFIKKSPELDVEKKLQIAKATKDLFIDNGGLFNEKLRQIDVHNQEKELAAKAANKRTLSDITKQLSPEERIFELECTVCNLRKQLGELRDKLKPIIKKEAKIPH